MSTLLQPHVTCVWGDILIGLGMSVMAFKPSGETFQAGGECTNHFHHIHHFRITISAFWLLTSPSRLVISWSSRPLSTWILQCLLLMTIGSGVTLNSTVMAEVLSSRTTLWLWEWFPITFRFDHWLFRRFSHKPLACVNVDVTGSRPYTWANCEKGKGDVGWKRGSLARANGITILGKSEICTWHGHPTLA